MQLYVQHGTKAADAIDHADNVSAVVINKTFVYRGNYVNVLRGGHKHPQVAVSLQIADHETVTLFVTSRKQRKTVTLRVFYHGIKT